MTRISDTLSTEIRRKGKPVITSFEIERLIYDLYRRGEYEGKSLMLRSSTPSARAVSALKGGLMGYDRHLAADYRMIDPAERKKIGDELANSTLSTLVSDLDFPASVWRVARVPDASPEELSCLVDPWCFISHLSAMQQWGLSNRNPVALHLTRPKGPLWREKAKAEVRTVYADLEQGDDEPHTRERVTFPPMLRGREISLFEPGYFGQSVAVSDSDSRIATVGQTFRDMLHEPALCGGMSHVLEVWEKHAQTYLDEIIEALGAADSHTTKIAFVRAGYILTEHMGISDRRVDAWTAFAERGGSRKLDPERPFEPIFSERWMLSLNV
jgi:hypothetical protein